MLGVQKVGKIYVSLNSSFPRARINFMLSDSQSTLLLTDNDHLSMAKELVGNELRLINVDDLDSNLSIRNPGIFISPTAVTWINYTSGSTGQPKDADGQTVHRTRVSERYSEPQQSARFLIQVAAGLSDSVLGPRRHNPESLSCYVARGLVKRRNFSLLTSMPCPEVMGGHAVP